MSASAAQSSFDWPYGWLVPAEPLVRGGTFEFAFLGFPIGSAAAKIAEDQFEAISPNWIAG